MGQEYPVLALTGWAVAAGLHRLDGDDFFPGAPERECQRLADPGLAHARSGAGDEDSHGRRLLAHPTLRQLPSLHQEPGKRSRAAKSKFPDIFSDDAMPTLTRWFIKTALVYFVTALALVPGCRAAPLSRLCPCFRCYGRRISIS